MKKRTAKLTIQTVANELVADKVQLLWDTELKNFHLRTTPRGVKSYGLFYRAKGQQRWLTLGRHGVLTPIQARDIAKSMLGEIARGGAPAVAKKVERVMATEALINRFGQVAKRFLADCKTELRTSTINAYTSILNCTPSAWKNKPVSELSRRDIIIYIDNLKAVGKRPKALLTVKVLNRFFGWCLDRELVSALPTTRIKLGQPKSRERTLTVPELRRVWAAADKLSGTRGDLIKLLILTGQRRGETGLMRWSDINAGTWVIPGSIAKNHRTHAVPLSPEAQALIARQPRVGTYVFALNKDKPIAPTAFDAIRREVEKRIVEDGQSPMELWRLHDLRRSLVTGLHEHGIADPHTIELIVNHVGGLRGGIAGVYDKSTRLDARRAALQSWACLLLHPEKNVNVVPIRKQA